MDSLFNILSRRVPDEPLEIRIVKEYIRENFDTACLVAKQGETIIVTVRSSSLAGSLRTRTSAIRQLLGNPEAKLRYHIGPVDE